MLLVVYNDISIYFDVVSFYTNIDTEEAILTVLDYVRSHKPRTFGLAAHDLHELLDLTLNINIFPSGRTFYVCNKYPSPSVYRLRKS